MDAGFANMLLLQTSLYLMYSVTGNENLETNIHTVYLLFSFKASQENESQIIWFIPQIFMEIVIGPPVSS